MDEERAESSRERYRTIRDLFQAKEYEASEVGQRKVLKLTAHQAMEIVGAVEGVMGDEANLRDIAALHQKTVTGDGGTDGFCSECQWLWPCKTYHIAMGYGSDAHNECVDVHWCSHEQVKM